MPVWDNFDITLLFHDAGAQPANVFGNDYIAGGAGNDQIFGELGNDTIQGDGSIDILGVGASRDGSNALVMTPSIDDYAGVGKDGDDYIEGGGGNDVIFGNLGQDDLIGGSSSLFKLTTPNQRPDVSDIIFGGSGTKAGRNDLGDTSANGHARDADTIVGDNGNIYRLVGVNGTVGGAASGVAYSAGFLSFNYDDYAGSTIKIIPRAASLLDYTPGGPSFNAAAASTDIGTANEVHGEAGDDFIYTGKGNDVIFGDGQDDDIVAGYGNDWVSGGTGDDGIIGDDGRIYTSRNGKAEPLNGVATATVQATVATGGNVQIADVNITGQLKKAVDITPYSQDPNWNPATDEFALASGGGVGVSKHNSDDILFGGWGNDFIHGGSGDDAISGAEALPLSYAPTYSAPGVPNGLVEIDWYHPFNPISGNVLAFNPTDVNGQHGNRTRAGEFALYDEYDPLRKILLNPDGSASKWTGPTPTGAEFFLNFSSTEGPIATGVDISKTTDGNDKIFGDLGNDWLIGGTGTDNMYGGMGNDLLNADDDLSSNGGLNNTPDTSASYQDRAFGGAGRDVLIANTGGDRLIDWTGEYNSYLVPFSPFGNPTVSRTLQPALMDFLYALSASDGADPTRAADTGADPARNGEPWGELGLVLQKDAAWRDQHGGPSDPQPGNSQGARDVLRTANFNTSSAQGFNPQVGTFSVVNNRYQVAPATATPFGDAISLFDESDTVIPTYFEMQATLNALKPTGGVYANAYLIFDWVSNTNFKFAGINVSNNKMEIGHYNGAWVVDNWTNQNLKPDVDYVVLLSVNGTTATLTQGTVSVAFTFAARIDSLGVKHAINDGIVGIATRGGTRAQIDDVVVQAPPGTTTLDKTVDFGATSAASGLFFNNAANAMPALGNWITTSGGRFEGTAASVTAPAVNLMGYTITPGALIDLTTTLRTGGQGGIVFDYQGASYYKFVTLSADSRQLLIGHVTGSGTVIDKTYAMSVSAGTDYVLGVKVRSSLVNVSINGAVVLSNVFNETLTVGGNSGYGFISMKGAVSGTTSFDIVRLRTDDALYGAPPAPLMAASAPTTIAASNSALAMPSYAELQAIVVEAKHRWALAGLDAAALAAMDTISFQFDDLDGLGLGQESGTVVLLDSDAAGFGWFVDRTPAGDSEFRLSGGLLTASNAESVGRVDLLSVVSHELGHVAGLEHQASGVMAATLAAGTRTVAHATAMPPVFRWGVDDAATAAAPLTRPGSDTNPHIDWSYGLAGGPKVRQNVPSSAPRWAGDFVNHMGQTESQRSPNAAMRIQLPVAHKVAHELSPLSNT